jgi:flagellar protein FlbD
MIHLTRLNSQPLALNSDLIKLIEEAPDTVISLVTGEKIVVRETTAQIVERIIAFRRAVLQGASCSWETRAAPNPQKDRPDGPAPQR